MTTAAVLTVSAATHLGPAAVVLVTVLAVCWLALRPS